MKLNRSVYAAGVVFAAAMAGYLLTMCPTVYAGDSGDFITASYTLGVAHPSGYPLYMILGKLFSLIPIGSVAYRYNLMGGFFAALTAAIVCKIIIRLTKSELAGVGGGLMIAYSLALWDQATVAEAYSINGFFVALILLLTLKWRDTGLKRDLLHVVVAFGFGMTNHISMMLYAPAFIYFIVKDKKKKIEGVPIQEIIACLVAPLLTYLYLPVAASMKPAYNWGNPDTLDRLITHITASIHRQTTILTLTTKEVFERFFGILYFYARQFSLSGVFVLGGLYVHGGKNRGLLNFTGFIAAADVFYALFLNDVSLDITTFAIPSIIIFSVWAGFGINDVLDWVKKKRKDERILQACVLVIVGIVFAANYYVSDKSQNLLAYDLAQNMLKTVDMNAVIFAQGDNIVFPLSYLLLVEKARPDVTLYEQTGLISHELYGQDYVFLGEEEHLRRQKEVEGEIIKNGAPVYYTTLQEDVPAGYRLEQTGLLYRVLPEGELSDLGDYWSRYDFRQIWESTIHLDYMSNDIRSTYYIKYAQYQMRRDVDNAVNMLLAASEISPDKSGIHYDLGNILIANKMYDDAIGEFKKRLDAEPNDVNAMNKIGQCYALKGDTEMAKAYHMGALKINPRDVAARFSLAGILMVEGNLQEALQHYTLITQAAPGYSMAYFNMGLIYYKAGKPEQAAQMWEKYIELAPDDKYAQEARDKILQIRAANNTTQ